MDTLFNVLEESKENLKDQDYMDALDIINDIRKKGEPTYDVELYFNEIETCIENISEDSRYNLTIAPKITCLRFRHLKIDEDFFDDIEFDCDHIFSNWDDVNEAILIPNGIERKLNYSNNEILTIRNGSGISNNRVHMDIDEVLIRVVKSG